MNCKTKTEQSGVERSGFRIMPGSNPSKYNNDQTGRAAANYGFEHLSN